MATQDPIELAPVGQVPDVKIFSIEFPGHIQNPEKVKEALGGEQAIINASAFFTSRPTLDST